MKILIDEEVLKLARECGGFNSGEEFVVNFYRAAFNAGLNAGAEAADKEIEGFAGNADRDAVCDAIRALEKK
jgi:hypothetical protein